MSSRQRLRSLAEVRRGLSDPGLVGKPMRDALEKRRE